MPRLLAAGLLALLLAGCGGDGRREAVDTAEQWIDAVAARDAPAACKVMAPVGVDALRQKFTGLGKKANCTAVVRAYRDALPEADLAAIRKAGLEAEGGVRKEQIGVFPKVKRFELKVILMRRLKGDWKIVSTTIGPD